MKYWDRRDQESKEELVVLKDGKIKDIDFSTVSGESIRVLKNGRWALNSNSNPTLQEAESLLEELQPSKRKIEGGKDYSKEVEDKIKINPFKTGKEEKTEYLKALYRTIKEKSDKIKSVNIKLMSADTKYLLENSFGTNIEKNKTQTAIFIMVTVGAEGEIQRSLWHKGKNSGYEMIEELNREEVAEEVVSKALNLLKAKPAPPGRYPIILDHELAGVFFHEAVGHACEADLHIEDASIFKGRVGEKVASNRVTLVDDPFIKGSRGSLEFDDEGAKARKTVMIKKGELVNLLHSRETASKLWEKTTGNGRASSYSNFQIPRMTNTVLKEGSYSFEEALEGINKGFYLKGTSGGQVETTKGEFLFNAEIGYKIENGEVKEPVRDVSLVGNVLNILKKINAVGKEKETAFRWGWCGKKGQRVPVDESCPFIRVEEAILGGRS